ncbi:hypothetical protein N8559_03735 [Gammaproteobacteria bacterium]|nr:hypothetical protein [Gammaproteobacteria bacterium]MDC1502140.1 hypothetical protein [Gammaproteobacteria bacterium]
MTQLFRFVIYFYHLRPAADFAMGHRVSARAGLLVDEFGAAGFAAVSILRFSRHDSHSQNDLN